jgi:hypothetical protein
LNITKISLWPFPAIWLCFTISFNDTRSETRYAVYTRSNLTLTAEFMLGCFVFLLLDFGAQRLLEVEAMAWVP